VHSETKKTVLNTDTMTKPLNLKIEGDTVVSVELRAVKKSTYSTFKDARYLMINIVNKNNMEHATRIFNK